MPTDEYKEEEEEPYRVCWSRADAVRALRDAAGEESGTAVRIGLPRLACTAPDADLSSFGVEAENLLHLEEVTHATASKKFDYK